MAKYFEITGLEAIDRKLASLETRIRNKVLRQAMRQAIKPMKAEVERQAPLGETGDLESSVKIRAGKRKKHTIRINVQIGEGDFKGDTFYAAFVEYGHHVGKTEQIVDGQYFMAEAFRIKGAEVRNLAIRLIEEGIKKELRKG